MAGTREVPVGQTSTWAHSADMGACSALPHRNRRGPFVQRVGGQKTDMRPVDRDEGCDWGSWSEEALGGKPLAGFKGVGWG